jgi:hypothetical protein
VAATALTSVRSAFKPALTAMVAGASQCWRDTHNRGEGVVPTNCEGFDNVANICYGNCANNYYKVALNCWERCASTHTDIGVSVLNNVLPQTVQHAAAQM